MAVSASTTCRGLEAPDEQERTPVFDALLGYQRLKIAPLCTPGHKGSWTPEGLQRLLTPLGLACDLPSMDATDYWFHPRSCIADAQHLAAALYGAADTFYLVNGSTIGVQAMVLAAVAPGEQVLLSRHLHVSAHSALVLGGAVPLYLPSRWLETGGPIPPTADEVDEYLRRHPDVRAVFLTHPTYYGLGRPLAGVTEACHRRGIPLLVDEAHGAHLRFLPPPHLPSGLDCGADLVVQSVHKTVGSLIGTAQLHRAHGSLISKERLQATLNLLQSTSSNYLLLASLDLVRRAMAREGRDLFGRAASRAAVLRKNLAGIDGIRILDPAHHRALDGCMVDAMRLVIDVAGLGLTGYQVERRLQDEFQILAEFSDSRSVAFVLGPADAPETYARLERGFRALSVERSRATNESEEVIYSVSTPRMVMTPREAAFRPKRAIPLCLAAGRVCGETITVYPPGIPQICSGEQFTAELVEHLSELSRQSAPVLCHDASLATVRVVD
jgi:arginine decarboxylase